MKCHSKLKKILERIGLYLFGILFCTFLLNIYSGNRIFGYFGRMHEKKNAENEMKAIQSLRSQTTPTQETDEQTTNRDETVVYICTGSSAYAYHKSSKCPGLNQCTHYIDNIPVSDAIKQGYSPCQRCY